MDKERDLESEFNEYVQYRKEVQPRWVYANEILYKMCTDNMTHEDDDIIASKVLLIGRSYAAAVERQHKGKPKGDEYYYDVFVPELKSLRIDESIASINRQFDIRESQTEIFKLHNAISHLGFNGKDGDDRRQSFASKYLHFHCKDNVFIYDERARRAVSRYIKSVDDKLDEDLDNKDYQAFVYKVLDLQKKLLKIDAKWDLSPRAMDDFLLWVAEKKELVY